MNKFDDDIREYDPLLWITPKKRLPISTIKPKPKSEPKPKQSKPKKVEYQK